MVFRTLLIASFAFALSSPSWAVDDLDITDSTCSVSYINEVAQKEGLEKAQKEGLEKAQNIASQCISAGYKDLEAQLKETGNTLVEHYEVAKDFLSEKTNEYSEKATNIKNELMR